MASLKNLRTRIASVKNTKKITSTMKMVAAAKMRKARLACEQSAPYATGIEQTVNTLAGNINKSDASVLLTGFDDVKIARLLVFGSDKGLCGGFNIQLIKEVELKITELKKQGKKIEIETFGNKARDGLKEKYADLIVKSHLEFSKTANYDVCQLITEELIKEVEENHVQEIYLGFNKFINVLTQKPTVSQLVPVPTIDIKGAKADVILEPSPAKVLNTLLPRFVASNIWQAYLESFASEQACRMTAMEGSTKNASEVIDKLSLEYNRQRQAGITSELVEIISGAQALNN